MLALALVEAIEITAVADVDPRTDHVIGTDLGDAGQDVGVVPERVGVKFNLILLKDPGAKTVLPTVPPGFPTWRRLALFRRFPGTKRQLQNPTYWV